MPIVWTKSKVIARLPVMKPYDSKKKNPHKPKRDFKSYLLYVMTAILLIFVADEVLWDGERPYITKMKADYYAEQAVQAEREKKAIEDLLPPKVVYPEDGKAYFEQPASEPEFKTEPNIQSLVIEEKSEKIVAPKAVEKAIKEKPKYNSPVIGPKPKIAIVIDDVGMNLSQSRAAIDLDKNVTLAFLPYAETVKTLASTAKAKGNEIIIHTPMEPMNGDIDLGTMALRTGMNPSDFNDEFLKITQSFDGYVGVNNHMGSRLTQDKQAMGQLMRLLKAKGLYFLDSKTINTSIAAETAAFYGVPYAVRDVFLDHEETPEFVANALAQTERTARRTGSAIAIGHPKKNTMQALRQWIPTLEKKGFELVPLSELIQKGAPSSTVISSDSEISHKISQSATQPIEMTKSEEKPKIEIKRVVPKEQKTLNFYLPE